MAGGAGPSNSQRTSSVGTQSSNCAFDAQSSPYEQANGRALTPCDTKNTTLSLSHSNALAASPFFAPSPSSPAAATVGAAAGVPELELWLPTSLEYASWHWTAKPLMTPQ